MKIAILFLTLPLLLVRAQVPPFNETCVTGTYPPTDKSLLVPTYIVNLDLPPEKRWQQVAASKSKQIKLLLNKFIEFAENFGNGTVDKIINYINERGDDMDKNLPQPFADEMRGIATASGLGLGEVIIYNLFYEVFTVCTSIVAESNTGKLYHARNMDFGLFLGWDIKNKTWEITEALRPMVINVDFQSKGKTVFKSVHFAGYIGVLTGIKPGVFTLSMNERFDLNGGYIGIIEWILGIRTGQWMGFLTRDTLQYADSYVEATKNLTMTKMLAPAYFIVGGNTTGQGTVITRDRNKAADVWNMVDAGGWYILETNYDHWKKPLFVDDRRTPANRCMKKMTKNNAGWPGMFNVLSSKPVLNKLTTYTALMQVNDGSLETWLQDCPDPCWPF